MFSNLIVSYYLAPLKQASEVTHRPGVEPIRPSQKPSIFYSKLLVFPFLKWLVLARTSPKATLNLKPGTLNFFPRAFDLDSNRSRTAVTLRLFRARWLPATIAHFGDVNRRSKRARLSRASPKQTTEPQATPWAFLLSSLLPHTFVPLNFLESMGTSYNEAGGVLDAPRSG